MSQTTAAGAGRKVERPPVDRPMTASDAKPDAATLTILDPKELRFARAGVELRLTVGDRCSYPAVKVLRAFPLSQPQRHLSVRDTGNREIGVIADPGKLDEASRRLVEEELDRRYLVPVIRRVIAVKEWFGTVDWQVETDRGEVRFTTRNLRENLVQPSPGRLLLTDVEGNRYDVPQFSALDSRSQGLLMGHL